MNASRNTRRDPSPADLSGRSARLKTALSQAAHREPVPAEADPTRADYRARLLAAYAEDRDSRPITGKAGFGSIEGKAGALVRRRCWDLAREVIALPPPTTPEALALAALAAAILAEVTCSSDDPAEVAARSLARAVLAFTGTTLPPGFVGFGDEPDYLRRDRAMHRRRGSLPAWALAEAGQDAA